MGMGKDLYGWYGWRHVYRKGRVYVVTVPRAILAGNTEIRHWLPLSSGTRGKSTSSFPSFPKFVQIHCYFFFNKEK